MNVTTNHHLLSENQRLQTERNELRRQLDETEGMLRAECRIFEVLAETLLDVVFIALPDGTWVYVNPCWYETTGLSADSTLGTEWTKALHPEESARVLREMRDAFESGVPYASTFRLQTIQGDRRFSASAHPVDDDSGRIVRWIGTLSDVTDLLTAQEALDEVHRRNRDFIRKLVHDLRNSMASIQYAIALLRSENAGVAQSQRVAELIEKQIREMRVFLANLQDNSEPRNSGRPV